VTDVEVLDGPYIWKFQTEEEGKIQTDVGTLLRGNKIAAGLGRYVVPGGTRSNVKLVPKDNTISTSGFQVRAGLTISKGDEIFE
jgi:hypothetical protein